MRKFHYRPGKSAFAGLAMAAAALVAGWVWVSSPAATFLPAGVALLCAAGAIKTALDAMSDTPALAFDARGLALRKTWGQVAEVAWHDVQSIGVEVFTLRYWGIIPISKTENLVVKCAGGLFGSRRLRLALRMIDLPAGGAGQLLALLNAAHVAAVGEATAAMAGADRQHGWGAGSAGVAARRADAAAREEGEGGFNADAALARYLARKEAGAGASPRPEATASAAAPARPVFGRRASAG